MLRLSKTFGIIATLFALLDLAFASPVINKRQPTAISFPLISRQKRVYISENDTAAISSASRSSKLIRREVQASGTYQGNLYYDSTEYLLEIQIGTGNPPQKFYVIVDTGSVVLWVYSYGCPKEQCKFERFNQWNFSPTYKTTGMEQVYYGYEDETFIVGYMGKDTVSIGSLSVENQEFVSVFEAIDVFSYDPKQSIQCTGMLGLGYSNKFESRDLSVANSKPQNRDYETLLSRMKREGVIPKGMFSMYLGSKKDTAHPDGFIVIGDYDMTHIEEQPKFARTILTKQGLPDDWALYGEGFTLYTDTTSATSSFASQNNDDINVQQQVAFQTNSASSINVIKEWTFTDKVHSNVYMLFDTGTTYSYFYPSYSREIFKLVTGKDAPTKKDDEWIMDCKHLTSNIFLRVRFSHEFQHDAPAIPDTNPLYLDVPIKNLIKQVDNGKKCIWSPDVKTGDNPEEGKMMLGQDFLRNFYLVHDFDNNQLGLAVPKGFDSRVSLKNN